MIQGKNILISTPIMTSKTSTSFSISQQLFTSSIIKN